MKKFVDLDNARLEEQKKVMEASAAEDSCPFCQEHIQKYHKQPVIKEGKFWFITKNQWPYDHTKHHLLAIYKKHIENLADIEPGAGDELITLFQDVQRKYNVLGGAFAMRFGDTNYSAGSVQHLHAQFIVPDLKSKDYHPVRFKIGKGH